MPAPHPLIVLLAAGPSDPGAGELVARALQRAQAGVPVRLLLSVDGLQWRTEPRLEALAAIPGVSVGVCSRQARDAGWTLDNAPDGITWSALVSWLRDAGGAQALWSALP